jgi:WD40 repeat protein
VPVGWWTALAGLVAATAVGLAVVASGPPTPADPAPPGKPTAGGQAAVEGPQADAIGDPLPPAALLRLGTTRFRHPGSAHALALSPDEKTVLTLGWEGLYAWDTATGKELWHADGQQVARDMNPAVGESRLAFLPDGRRAVTPGDGHTFKLWDVATGKAETRKVAVQGARAGDDFRSVAVSPDGQTLALGGASGVYVCDLSGAVFCHVSNDPGGPRGNPNKDRLLAWRSYCYGRFSPDGKLLAVVGSDAPEVIRLCDAANGAEKGRIQLSQRFLDLAFSPDSKRLAVAERDDTVRVYPAAGGKPVWTWPVEIKGANENYIFQVVFSPDGKTVAAASSDKLIRLWDSVTGKEVGRLQGHGWYPWGLAFTADSRTLYSTGWDGEVRRWNVATRKQLPLPVGVRGSALVAYAPDGREVVYADGDDILRWVDVKTGRETRKVHAPDLSPSQMWFSPDGKALAVGGRLHPDDHRRLTSTCYLPA